MSVQCSEVVVRSQDLPYFVAFTSRTLGGIKYLGPHYNFLMQAFIGLIVQQATADDLVNHYSAKRWATTRMIEIVPDTPYGYSLYRS